jgi:hypothetical protein
LCTGFAIHGVGSEASSLAGVAAPVFNASHSYILALSHIRLIICATVTIIKFYENPFGGSQSGT